MFAERLVLLRKSRNLTEEQVCEAIDVSEHRYKQYEHGGKEPSYDKLLALADYFGVSIDYLAGRSDEPKINR